MRYFVRVFDVPQQYSDYNRFKGKIIEVIEYNGDYKNIQEGNYYSIFWKDDPKYDKYREFLTEEVVNSDLFQAIYGGISE